jgi:hypothetical protein
MPSSSSSSFLRDGLRTLTRSLSYQGPLQILLNIPEAWDALSRLHDKLRYHGMYEILDYDATLEILDPRGETAVLTHREVIHFLQDNVVAIHDHAWGDGDLFARYHCQPGVPVDFYEDGRSTTCSSRFGRRRTEGT